jgi:hypothetical protein
MGTTLVLKKKKKKKKIIEFSKILKKIYFLGKYLGFLENNWISWKKTNFLVKN